MCVQKVMRRDHNISIEMKRFIFKYKLGGILLL